MKKNKVRILIIIVVAIIVAVMLIYMAKKFNKNNYVTISDQNIKASTTLIEALEKGYIKIGDYVNYSIPTEGEYISQKEKNGYGDQIFEISNNGDNIYWRILGYSPDRKNIMLISSSPIEKKYDLSIAQNKENNPYYNLSGPNAYVNLESELNNICSIFKNNYAEIARSINVNDINSICNVNVKDGKILNSEGNNIYIGNIITGSEKDYTNQYANANDFLNKYKSNFKNVDDSYCYSGRDTLVNDDIYNMLFKDTSTELKKFYWINAHSTTNTEKNVHFNVGVVDSAIVDLTANMFCSCGAITRKVSSN